MTQHPAIASGAVDVSGSSRKFRSRFGGGVARSTSAIRRILRIVIIPGAKDMPRLVVP